MKKSVFFSTVMIRRHDITIGDSPCVSSGVPLTLDWTYTQDKPISIDVYEVQRQQPPRTLEKFRLTAREREFRLVVNFGVLFKDLQLFEQRRRVLGYRYTAVDRTPLPLMPHSSALFCSSHVNQSPSNYSQAGFSAAIDLRMTRRGKSKIRPLIKSQLNQKADSISSFVQGCERNERYMQESYQVQSLELSPLALVTESPQRQRRPQNSSSNSPCDQGLIGRSPSAVPGVTSFPSVSPHQKTQKNHKSMNLIGRHSRRQMSMTFPSSRSLHQLSGESSSESGIIVLDACTSERRKPDKLVPPIN